MGSCVATPTQSFVSCVKMKKKSTLPKAVCHVSTHDTKFCVMCRHTDTKFCVVCQNGKKNFNSSKGFGLCRGKKLSKVQRARTQLWRVSCVDTRHKILCHVSPHRPKVLCHVSKWKKKFQLFQRLWFVSRQEVEQSPTRADTVVACVMCRHTTQNSVSCVATPTQSFVSCVKMKKKNFNSSKGCGLCRGKKLSKDQRARTQLWRVSCVDTRHKI